jgi:hypothetical protein
LHKRYDVVQCLFSSIGYLLKAEDLISALRCFKKHLAPGGIVLVEPWILPEKFVSGRASMDTVDKPEIKICRMALSGREGDISTIVFQYLIATSGGIVHREESHRLALVSVETMMGYFHAAGLDCEYDPEGVSGRGLFIGRESETVTKP